MLEATNEILCVNQAVIHLYLLVKYSIDRQQTIVSFRIILILSVSEWYYACRLLDLFHLNQTPRKEDEM